MPFDEEIKGDPFRGDYPGLPDHQPWDELEARVQRKAIDLARRRYEPAHRHEVLRLLTERRSGAQPGAEAGGPQQHAGGAVAQIGSLPAETGFDTLVTPGELLITGQSYDGRLSPDGTPGPGPSAKAYLDALGMAASEVECAELHGRVLRLTPPEGTVMTPQQHADLARVLRSRGFNASLSYITPTAPIVKDKAHRSPSSRRPARRNSVTAGGHRRGWRSSTPASPTRIAPTGGWTASGATSTRSTGSR